MIFIHFVNLWSDFLENEDVIQEVVVFLLDDFEDIIEAFQAKISRNYSNQQVIANSLNCFCFT